MVKQQQQKDVKQQLLDVQVKVDSDLSDSDGGGDGDGGGDSSDDSVGGFYTSNRCIYLNFPFKIL